MPLPFLSARLASLLGAADFTETDPTDTTTTSAGTGTTNTNTNTTTTITSTSTAQSSDISTTLADPIGGPYRKAPSATTTATATPTRPATVFGLALPPPTSTIQTLRRIHRGTRRLVMQLQGVERNRAEMRSSPRTPSPTTLTLDVLTVSSRTGKRLLARLPDIVSSGLIPARSDPNNPILAVRAVEGRCAFGLGQERGGPSTNTTTHTTSRSPSTSAETCHGGPADGLVRPPDREDVSSSATVTPVGDAPVVPAKLMGLVVPDPSAGIVRFVIANGLTWETSLDPGPEQYFDMKPATGQDLIRSAHLGMPSSARWVIRPATTPTNRKSVLGSSSALGVVPLGGGSISRMTSSSVPTTTTITQPLVQVQAPQQHKYVLSALSPNVRRHPVVGSLNRDQLAVKPEYRIPIPIPGPSPIPHLSSSTPASSGIGTTPWALQALAILSGIWLARMEGWPGTDRVGGTATGDPSGTVGVVGGGRTGGGRAQSFHRARPSISASVNSQRVEEDEEEDSEPEPEPDAESVIEYRHRYRHRQQQQQDRQQQSQHSPHSQPSRSAGGAAAHFTFPPKLLPVSLIPDRLRSRNRYSGGSIFSPALPDTPETAWTDGGGAEDGGGMVEDRDDDDDDSGMDERVPTRPRPRRTPSSGASSGVGDDAAAATAAAADSGLITPDTPGSPASLMSMSPFTPFTVPHRRTVVIEEPSASTDERVVGIGHAPASADNAKTRAVSMPSPAIESGRPGRRSSFRRALSLVAKHIPGTSRRGGELSGAAPSSSAPPSAPRAGPNLKFSFDTRRPSGLGRRQEEPQPQQPQQQQNPHHHHHKYLQHLNFLHHRHAHSDVGAEGRVRGTR